MPPGPGGGEAESTIRQLIMLDPHSVPDRAKKKDIEKRKIQNIGEEENEERMNG